MVLDKNEIMHKKKCEETTKPNITEAVITTGRKPEGKGWKIHTTRTTGRKQHNSGTLREIQCACVTRKCAEKYIGYGEYHDHLSVRQ